MRGAYRNALVTLGLVLGTMIACQSARAELRLTDLKAAYGPMWPERTSAVYYQGKDALFFRFIVRGFKPTAQGGFEFESRLSLVNSAGETIKLQSLPQQGALLYGRDAVIGFAGVQLDQSCVPGEYKAVLTVKDKGSGQSVSETRPITVKAEEWAIAQVSIFTDAEHRQPTSLTGVTGETKHYFLGVIGFDAEGVDCQITGRILGPSRNEVSKHEWSKTLKKEEIPAGAAVLTFSNNLGGFSAPGTYRLILTATDRIKGQSSTCELPFEIRLP
jgi:hypothetical protein